jgi:RNA polymerase sigma factor (sigma-70 family)
MRGNGRDRFDLFIHHRGALIRFATPIVGCPIRAEDVVQEAFLRYAPIADRPSLREPINYLYRIVRNLSIDMTKAGRFGNLPIADNNNNDLELIQDQTLDPEQVAITRDELRVILGVLAELPERTQRIFVYHRIEGRTLQSIASELGLSVGRVHQLFNLALKKIADRLETIESV